MSIDVIVTWPRNTDYPLWRKFIKDNRFRFERVIVVFMETNQGEDYREFLRDVLSKDDVLCIDSPLVNGGEDWRNIAVNEGLRESLNSEWVWFTEQDFFVNEGFWDVMSKIMDDKKVGSIGVKSGNRLHPCSLFIRRSVLGKTKKDFGARPPEFDHFGQVQKDLEYMKAEHDIVILPEAYYLHMNGLSHNMRLVSEGGVANHQREQFLSYLHKCMEAGVPLHSSFIRIAESQLRSL